MFLLLIEQVLHGSGGLLFSNTLPLYALFKRASSACTAEVSVCGGDFLNILLRFFIGGGGSMNISWQELFEFCLVILETIELIVQIKKK